MQKAMGSYKAGGAGEVRRINVVYFLSRAGRTDHPHLFRVNHLHRSGVRLRDVKRWLSEVRGKDMPENFSWAYKRKYKAGYVWQDLMDDDLITPISDNEYVLKGCDVRGSPPPNPCSHKPKSSSLADEKKLHGEEDKGRKVLRGDQKQVPEELQVAPDCDESSPKPPPPIDQDSPSSEGEAARFRIVLPLDLQERKRRQQEAARSAVVEQKAVASAGGRKQHPGVGSSGRMRVARVLHSILTCGTADAVDAALQPVVLARRSGVGSSDDDDDDGWRETTPVCPGMDGCGIHMNRKVRVRRGGKEKAKRPEGGRRDCAVAAAHRPSSLPLCSQCGKEFKPQELHSHMQLCRGLRARMRSSSNGGRVNVGKNHGRSGRAEVSSPAERSSTGLLLTHS